MTDEIDVTKLAPFPNQKPEVNYTAPDADPQTAAIKDEPVVTPKPVYKEKF